MLTGITIWGRPGAAGVWPCLGGVWGGRTQPLPDPEVPSEAVPFDRDELWRAGLVEPELCAVPVLPASEVVLAPVPVAVPLVVSVAVPVLVGVVNLP